MKQRAHKNPINRFELHPFGTNVFFLFHYYSEQVESSHDSAVAEVDIETSFDEELYLENLKHFSVCSKDIFNYVF